MAIEVVSVDETRFQRISELGRDLMARLRRIAGTRKGKLILRIGAALVVVAVGLTTYFFYSSYTSYAEMIDARLARGYLTSRAGIYAAPRNLRAGQLLDRDGLIALLRRAGYVETAGGDVWNGSFATREGTVVIRPHYVDGRIGPAEVSVVFTPKGRIARIEGDGATLPSFTLEPEILSSDASMKTGTHSTASFQELPTVVVRSILSIEDRRFFDHSGIDPVGLGRAVMHNAGDDRTVQGGSTITQQLVKNTYLSPERTLRRKYAEMMLAFALERRLSKQEIFALYCNEVYLGQRGAVGVRGVSQAARVYFDKELYNLSLAEAATIAGMIQSPNRYAPDRHPAESLERRRTVLAGMVRDGFIDTAEAAAASQETLALAPVTGEGESAPYFVDYVNRVAEQQLAALDRADERSPRVYTTIDPELQNLAESAIKRQMDAMDASYPGQAVKPQAALVAIDPRTGNVVAMVGGRNYSESQLNRVTDAQRQPGSVFKPFVYAAALETNISPAEVFHDAPREFVYDRNRRYRPANFGGRYSGRDVMMRDALVRSLNTVTVDVAMHTGLNRVARMAAEFGLPRPLAVPAAALGTTEATPLSVAAAYTAFVNGGKRAEPNVIASITGSDGREIVRSEPRTRSIVDPQTAYMITDMLQSVIQSGTARRARGAAGSTAIAGKTGTSRDSWFVGYTPNLVCVVWIGFDDNSQLGRTGADAALPVWTQFIKAVVDARPELGGREFAVPAGINFVQVDPETARLVSPECPNHETIAVTTRYAPHSECGVHYESLTYEAETAEIDYSAEEEVQMQESDRPEPIRARSRTVVVNSSGRKSLVTELSAQR